MSRERCKREPPGAASPSAAGPGIGSDARARQDLAAQIGVAVAEPVDERVGRAPALLDERAELGEVDALVLAVLVEAPAPLEPARGDVDDALRELGERRAAERGRRAFSPMAGRSASSSAAVYEAVSSSAAASASLVVEDARPQRGQRADEAGRERVGAADLDRVLEAHLGEQRVEVRLPVAQRRRAGPGSRSS